MFREAALYRIEQGHRKLDAKRLLVKELEFFSYEMMNNDRLLDAYAAGDVTFKNGKPIESSYIKRLVRKSKNYSKIISFKDFTLIKPIRHKTSKVMTKLILQRKLCLFGI